MAPSQAQQGVDIGAKMIGEFVTDDYTLRLEAHNSQLECCASISVHNVDQSISPTDLISILRNHDITKTVDLEQVAIFCTKAAQGADPQQFIIAAGTEPTDGKDGWFELVVNTGKEESDLAEDDSGRVDFKSLQTFTNVDPEQHIGTINLPTGGTPGNTISGEVLHPQAGKPCNIIAGNGTAITEAGTKVVATQQGRVVFDKNVITVAEELVINGDVDLSVGHIHFNGFVDIKGDVLDDFNISATKGIHVSGAVGDCQISADGPITIGTMAGRGRGKISCKGKLTARYLNQVQVECWGDVEISHELRNAFIKSTGSVKLPKGLVTGGEIIALEGVEAKIIGASTGTKTYITSGVYFPEVDRLKFLRTRVKSLAEQTKRLKTSLDSLNRKPYAKQRKALREAIELRIGILTNRHVNLYEEREELTEELQSFKADTHPTANPKINVMTMLKEGAEISLGETSTEITNEISGPASIVENQEQNGLRYLTYSPLIFNAASMDEAAPAA